MKTVGLIIGGLLAVHLLTKALNAVAFYGPKK
jgi:hypothetical protein